MKKVLLENMAVLILSSNFIYDVYRKVYLKNLYLVFQGVTVQMGSKDCGLFVVRYMKEIVYDKELHYIAKVSISLSLISDINFLFTITLVRHVTYKKIWSFFQWMRRTSLVYTDDDINKIRIDFANFFMKYHAI